MLWENELPEMAIQGLYKNGNGILVCTNSRLIFVHKGLISLKVEDFPLKSISSIQYETGILLGKLTIFASGNRAEIGNVDKNFVRIFAEYVRSKISGDAKQEKPSETPQETRQASAKDDEIIVQLECLAILKEKGILTDDEFVAQKARILGL
nr:PH domain-containing protein [Moraxella nasicaprae]